MEMKQEAQAGLEAIDATTDSPAAERNADRGSRAPDAGPRRL
jgi:hypothetical protein